MNSTRIQKESLHTAQPNTDNLADYEEDFENNQIAQSFAPEHKNNAGLNNQSEVH